MISESLLSGTKSPPLSRNAVAADRFAERLTENAGQTEDDSLREYWERVLTNQQARRVIDGITGNSPFLAGILVADPEFSRLLFEDGPDAALAAAFRDLSKVGPATAATDTLKKVLRETRKRVALTCAVADCQGAWELERVTGALSDFAETALSAATSHLLRSGHDRGEIVLPDPDTPESQCGFICLGMGKLGAKELNYSSDIDLILLYDHELIDYTGKRSPQEFFSRFARDLLSVIEERTRDGYVFRVDLRLRPDPGSTPPVISTLAAETYYESAGQNWERAAMIKARPVAGDREAGEEFLQILRPFIWRRSLDFAAIQDIHSIKRQINAVRGGAKIAVAGHNVKLGRGGIREIEFFAQTQQLIWGGRDAGLRSRPTCDSLRALTDAEHVDPAARDDMLTAYGFLRRIEHRLQMIDDQQTHQIPDDPDKIETVAAFSGYETVEAFVEAVSNTLHTVEDHYAALFEEAPALSGPGSLVFTGGEDHPDTLHTLSEMGFREPATTSGLVRNWHHGRFRALRSARARELLTEMVPALLEAFSKTLDPDAALMRFNDFLSGLPAGVQLLSLLHTNPALFDLLSEIMGSAPLLAETLKRHPILFDAVLTSDFFDAPPDAQTLTGELQEQLKQANDFEDVLDISRRQVNDRIFQTGVLILRGHLSPSEAGGHLTAIADSVLSVLYNRVIDNFAERHGRFADGDMAIVALGKLGGGEITIGSDLDLLLVYDNGSEDTSTGERPLTAIPYFTRLGQRYLSAISSPTGQGTLYEVDMRLRPSGNAGPLATSLASFVEYHRTAAWTWEHMALTRARIVHAESKLQEVLETAINAVLTLERDPDKLLADVADMRARMERDRKSAGPWDVKNMRGGLVDIEFIAQYLQLRHAHLHPEILSPATGTALKALVDGGLLDADHATALQEGLVLWRNLQGILRLTVGENFDETASSDASRATLARACGAKDLDSLQTLMASHGERCHAIFRELIEIPAEKISRES